MDRSMLQLTKEEKKKLVKGYIEEVVNNEYMIPEELTGLCSRFYDEMLYWTVSRKFMERHFFSLQNGCGIIGPSFACAQGIEYQIIIYPKGSQPAYDNYCECFFRLKSKCFKASQISEVLAYFQIGCLETNTEYRNVGRFTVKESWSNWYPFNMKSNEIKQYPSLTFSLFVDVLRVTYAASSGLEARSKEILMRPKLNYQWKIGASLWKKLTFYGDNKRFYSPHAVEDGCWTLYCTPNTSKLYFQLYLRLIRLPPQVKAVKVRCHLTSNVAAKRGAGGTRGILTSLAKLDYTQNSIKLATLKPSQLLTVKELQLSLKLQVVQAWDYQDRRIKPRHWRSHGITPAPQPTTPATQWKRKLASQTKQWWTRCLQRRSQRSSSSSSSDLNKQTHDMDQLPCPQSDLLHQATPRSRPPVDNAALAISL